MSIVATRRLIAASASLDPAGRALLNLWVNRGLDDPALARMTGMTTEAIAARREKIVEQLSEELGLPPAQIGAALAEMAASSAPEQGEPGQDKLESEPGQHELASEPDQHELASEPGQLETESESEPVQDNPGGAARSTDPGQKTRTSPQREVRLWLALGLALLLVVAIVLILALGSSQTKDRPPTAARTATATSPTATATTPTTASASTSLTPPATPAAKPTRTGPVAPARHQTLAALPGGNPRISGSVDELGTPGHLKLRVSVTGLPPAKGGHYEVWLYNTVLDSRAMGPLPAGSNRITLPLGRHAHHFRWIDISFQPRGVINHSGESVLRAANPDETVAAKATR